ncbi:AL2CL protein, partial [Rhipidura dahli]|nr:AL2CL protein [Rhipidura dahli]
VVQGFEAAADSRSEAWKLHKPVLKQFLRDFTPESSLARALHSVLQQPLRNHIRSYVGILSQLQELLPEGSERDVVAAVLREFGKLELFIGQVLDEAACTKELWNSLGYKFTEVLRVPERRLLADSRNIPIASGSGRSERILLFDDVLVLIQGNAFRSFDLKLVWLEENCGGKSAPEWYGFRVTTPEETFVLSAKDPRMKAVWRWKLEQAVRQALRGKRDFPLWSSGEAGAAPSRRFFSYQFRREGRLRGATYEGEWLRGKPHGKGTLKWSDGSNHVGNFREGLEHGFGIRLIPRRSGDRSDCYKCHWSQGRMRGYGICEYGNDSVYKGYFRDNARHGFGILESSASRNSFKYTGHWEKDKKNGYGIWEDKERGERYIGMWRDDRRHGAGIVLSQAGICFQRTFQADKMVGPGILLLEDDSVYEGNFTEDLTFIGKGKLSFPNGFVLEGTFGTRNSRGLQTHGILNTSMEKPEERTPNIQLGLKEFPVEKRWEGIFEPFREFVRCGCEEELAESFLGFHIPSGRELRNSQEFLACQRDTEEVSWKTEDILEELVRHQELESLQRYLEKALKSSLHPLGKLLRVLTEVFQASYSGIGASRHLLGMAQEEVKFYAKKIWEFYQDLLRLALERKGPGPSGGAEPRPGSGSAPVLRLLLGRLQPELRELYLLLHARRDQRYGHGILELSRFPDLRLLHFLDVHRSHGMRRDLGMAGGSR